MVRRRLVVSGTVQGVWFRESCRREAGRLGLTGWVRNRPDGRLEVEVEGAPDRIARFEAWAHEGPPQASVERIEGYDIEPEGSASFEIR